MVVQIGDRPGADFSDPLQLLSDCHRRIERFLGILQQVAVTRAGRSLDREHREAMTAALKYFREAAPKHTADEEESLFPRLEQRLAGCGQAVAEQIKRLGSDHRLVEAHHAQVERLAAAWLRENQLPMQESEELLQHLTELKTIYASHIQLEDTELFPAAKATLAHDELSEVGREMAARRGIRVLRHA